MGNTGVEIEGKVRVRYTMRWGGMVYLDGVRGGVDTAP